MGKIRILPDQVANKIAAGEVVERPASVVKELLENSLDAGATELRVEVEEGGKRLIRVTDNGCGMGRDDAMLAFERHATSKLRDAKELFSIATLGFRGEALPSIASVSRLVLETRAAEEPTGTRVEVAGGKMLRCEEAALPVGTQITVRDLFFNVPVRKKFLRSVQTELAHIASLVTHYSLANWDKDFLLRSEGKALLEAPAVATLRERVFQVFGGQLLEDLVAVGERTGELTPAPESRPPWRRAEEEAPAEAVVKQFRLTGFLSRPQVQKMNRNSIFLFVNRRLIKDKVLMHALASGYQNVIPPHTFPFALLFLECPFDEVDVNVHPSKTEVRFRHQTFVHDFVRDSIRAALEESRPAPSLGAGGAVGGGSRRQDREPAGALAGPQPAAGLPYSEFTQRVEDFVRRQAFSPVVAAPGQETPGAAPEFVLKPAPAPAPRLDFGGGSISVRPDGYPPPVPPGGEAPEPAGVSAGAAGDAWEELKLHLPLPDSHGALPLSEQGGEPEKLDSLREARVLGQLRESFIIAVDDDGLWIIDQHVAHERILFERTLEQRRRGGVERQQLLTPLVVDLAPAQMVEFERIAGELSEAGFDVEAFGARSIAIKAAPSGLAVGDIEQVLEEILEISERELRRTSMEERQAAIAATVACRAAIKVNMRLDAQRMEWLLQQLAATRHPMSCPHGRPIALRYSLRDILRSFHRI